MKKLIIVLAILALAVIPVFAGGEQEAAEEAGEKSAEDMHVVLVVKDLTNPFFVDMKNGAEAAAEEYGMKYSGLAPEKYSVEMQVRIMEDLVQQQVDGIVIVPIDGAGIISGVEAANDAGIPVMNANTKVQGGEVIGFAGIDHVAIGEGLGKFAAEYLDGEGKIVILEGTSGASSAIDRLDGMHNILDGYSGIEILESTTAKYNRQMAMQVTEDLLTRFPEIDLILCANDTMALGAKEAVLDARRDIAIAGADAIPEAVEAVIAGDLAATIDSDGFGQAYTAMDLLCKYLTTGEKPPAETKIGTGGAKIIDAENAEAFLESKGN